MSTSHASSANEYEAQQAPATSSSATAVIYTQPSASTSVQGGQATERMQYIRQLLREVENENHVAALQMTNLLRAITEKERQIERVRNELNKLTRRMQREEQNIARLESSVEWNRKLIKLERWITPKRNARIAVLEEEIRNAGQ